MGGLGGRVDQAFSQIHHLAVMRNKRYYRHEDKGLQDEKDEGQAEGKDELRMALYLISEQSVTFMLGPGKNIIHTPATNRPGNMLSSYFFEENVGIIPALGPTSITTRGFEWDVVDWPTAIGGQVSTSNHIRADVVSVQAPDVVMFTVELATRLKREG